MGKPGIVGTVKLAGALVIATPAFLFGVGRIADGRVLLGGAFVLLAALVIAAERYLTNPFDPVDVAEEAADRLPGKE